MSRTISRMAPLHLNDSSAHAERCYHLAFADCDGDGRDELFASFVREPRTEYRVPNSRSDKPSDGALRVIKIALRQNLDNQ